MPETPLPRISIVSPVLNQEKYLEECIRSIVDQGYPSLEYIVIDGGSTDKSLDIIKKHSSNISYWVSEPDEGHGDALNKGFRRTSGEIMGWLNGDDMLTPWSLRVVADIFSSFPEINWILGAPFIWNMHGHMTRAYLPRLNKYSYIMGAYKWISQEAVFWRRSLWEKAGSYISTDYEYMIDGDLWSRFFLYDKLWNVDGMLGGYRWHDANRAQSNMAQCEREMEKCIALMRLRLPRRDLQVAQTLQEVSTRLARLSNSEKIKLLSELDPQLINGTCHHAVIWSFDKHIWDRRCIPFWSTQ